MSGMEGIWACVHCSSRADSPGYDERDSDSAQTGVLLLPLLPSFTPSRLFSFATHALFLLRDPRGRAEAEYESLKS